MLNLFTVQELSSDIWRIECKFNDDEITQKAMTCWENGKSLEVESAVRQLIEDLKEKELIQKGFSTIKSKEVSDGLLIFTIQYFPEVDKLSFVDLINK